MMPMPPPAILFAEPRDPLGEASPRDRPIASGTWRTLLRHQVGAVVAGVVDFGTMIACVEGLKLSPVWGTAIGATLGGVTNFSLGRTWIFRRVSGHAGRQALRYAFVSAASAGFNTLGEHLVHDLAHVQYVLARGLVAFAVSVLWNFPAQRRFVFHEPRFP